MPDEFSDPHNENSTDVQSRNGADLSVALPRLSFKAGLTIYVSAGFLLYFLSRLHYPLVHAMVELASIILLATVFLIGWNTRHLVRSQFFVILASGFLAAGFVDLLHTLAYKGMNVLSGADANVATQLWLVARTLGGVAFFGATISLGRKEL